ncbi:MULTISPECIES: hypothetical protein [unclassified Adlercreutzia]|nr:MULTISPECIES: hypothetical protein [unclassified Adlercreutzia]
MVADYSADVYGLVDRYGVLTGCTVCTVHIRPFGAFPLDVAEL